MTGLLSSLKPNDGARSHKHRVGRGNGSGWGGTAGKGHKGQKARSGGSIRPGFEGGQTPLYRRLPKFGFTNHSFKKTYTVISLSDLESMTGDVTIESVPHAKSSYEPMLKVLGNGEIKRSVKVRAHKVTKSAKAAIEAAGGTVEIVE